MSHSFSVVLFAVAPIVWSGSTCDPSHGPATDGPAPVVIADIDESCAFADDGGEEVESIAVADDTLTVVVGYDGGCRVHTLASCWDGGWSVTTPMSVDVAILHDDGGDSCDGWVTDTVAFDVSFIRSETLAEMPGTLGVWIDVDGRRAWYAF